MCVTGFDRHAILLNGKVYACMDGALYQLGNNFHKIVNIPNLNAEDSAQNMGVCGDSLLISNFRNEYYLFNPSTKQLSEVFFPDLSGKAIMHFADRSFYLSDEFTLYYIDPIMLKP